MTKKKTTKKQPPLKRRAGRSEDRPRRVDHIEIEGGRVNGRTLYVRVAHDADGVRLSLGSSFSKLQMAITGDAAAQLALLAAPIVEATA